MQARMPAESNISVEDRRAATTVTTSGSGHRFEIQLGHLCNNRCVFCSSGQLSALKIARPIAIEPIVEALEEARARGATHVTFLGGEPTIHKRFLDALARAVEIGFEQIVIFTNGVMFPHPGFIDAVTALGRFEWRISIQGATADAHVTTTGREDSFDRILYGLGELQRRGQLVTANMCVNERSYRSLPAYPELLARYGVRQLHVDIVRPESAGERDEAYLREIMPRYSNMAPYYAAMLEGFERTDPEFDVNIGNLPYCILPEWGSSIHHGGQETITKSSDGSALEDAMNKYAWHSSLRRYLPGCDGCVFRSRCTGVFRGYLELHGSDEFRPVSRGELLVRDPARRNLVLLIEPLLGPLRAALVGGELPAQWRLLHERSEDRRRRVEIELAYAGGGEVRLGIVAPGTVPHHVLRCEAYDVEADADLEVSAEALDDLLVWVRGRLAEGLAPGAGPEPAHDAVDRALRRALMRRGRQRVALLAERLHSGFSRPGWRLDRLRWADESTGELVVRGPAGAHVDLRFALGVRGSRSQVGVDFRSAAPADEGGARAVIDDLVRLLRGASPDAGAASIQ